MNTFDDRVSIANDILKKLGNKSTISNVHEIDYQFLLLLYQLLFKSVPLGLVESSNDNNIDVSNIKVLLESLSRDILHVSLSHIDPQSVFNGVPAAVMNILEIFQGLANCAQRGNNTDINNGGSSRLKDTNVRVDNLASMTEQVFGRQSGNREEYLQRKIEELLGRQGVLSDRNGPCRRLQSYVDDEHDRIVLMVDRCSHQNVSGQSANISGNKDNDDKGKISSSLTMTNCHNGMVSPHLDCEVDDLTMVTHNGGHEDSVCDTHSSHGSQDTYVVSSSQRPIIDNTTRDTVTQDCHMKEAWAQVNKDLIQDRYENEFLEMLLQEEENVVRDRSRIRSKMEDERGKCIGERQFTMNESQRHMKGHAVNSTPRRRVDVRPSGGSFVRPIVRHIGHSGGSRGASAVTSGASSARHEDSDRDDTMTRLLREFPGLSVSEQTLRQMWSQATSQAANIQRVQHELVSRLGPVEMRVENARHRQLLLFTLLRKEALHQARLLERVEERESQLSLKASKDKLRQQSAKARRYYDEFSQNMRARMLQKQAREEQVFRTMFKATLKLQRERINELRRYARDKKNEKLWEHERDLDSLENYYRDRFSMLAECLRGERRQLRIQDKSQEQSLQRQRQELRLSMEKDIRMLQDSMVRSDHEAYFRGLDAEKVITSMNVHK